MLVVAFRFPAMTAASTSTTYATWRSCMGSIVFSLFSSVLRSGQRVGCNAPFGRSRVKTLLSIRARQPHLCGGAR